LERGGSLARALNNKPYIAFSHTVDQMYACTKTPSALCTMLAHYRIEAGDLPNRDVR
jgi:hypothetical protein